MSINSGRAAVLFGKINPMLAKKAFRYVQNETSKFFFEENNQYILLHIIFCYWLQNCISKLHTFKNSLLGFDVFLENSSDFSK